MGRITDQEDTPLAEPFGDGGVQGPVAAVPGPQDILELTTGPSETFPERMAADFVRRLETSSGNDPLLALLRTGVIDNGAAGRLLKAMEVAPTNVFRGVLGEQVAESVGPLFGALLIGVTFCRYIAKAGDLAEMDPKILEERLAGSIRALLTATVPGNAKPPGTFASDPDI